MERVLYSLIALGLILGSAVQTKAEFVFTTIDVPGSSQTEASGINNSSQIVGDYNSNVDGGTHGFLLSGGGYTTIDVPGSTETRATGINDSARSWEITTVMLMAETTASC